MGGAVGLETAELTASIQCVIADGTFASLWSLFVHHAERMHVPGWLAPIAATCVVGFASLMARANLFRNSPVRSIRKISPRPILIIQAGDDELIPASETERLYAAAGELKELWKVDGASHRAVDKLARKDYEARVGEFLDRYLASPNIFRVAERFSSRAAETAHAGLSQAAE